VFTLGAFLKVDAAAFKAELADRRGATAVLAWSALGVPLLTFAVLEALQPDRSLATGMLLCTLAPPVGSAAAIAAMLGLSPSLALLATVAPIRSVAKGGR
jgi:hypothetical protein